MRITLSGTMIAMIVMIAAIATSNTGAGMEINGGWTKQVVPAPDTQSARSKGIQLTVRTEKESFDSDEVVLLLLSVRNTTRRAVFLVETYSAREYKFDVKNEKGEDVLLTEEGQHLLTNNAVYRSGPLTIEPGEEKQHNVSINRIYDMTAPGTYSVTVRRKIFKMSGKLFTEAISNTLKVTIAD